jgi:adenylate kinase
MAARVRVMVITGSMGAGKTTVLGEASDLLTDVAREMLVKSGWL